MKLVNSNLLLCLFGFILGMSLINANASEANQIQTCEKTCEGISSILKAFFE